MAFCGNCGHKVNIPLPVEPLYTAEDVAMFVPTTKASLISWANKHKALMDPPQYRWWKGQRRRLFTAKDIKTVRAALVSSTRYPVKALLRGVDARAQIVATRTEADISVTGR